LRSSTLNQCPASESDGSDAMVVILRKASELNFDLVQFDANGPFYEEFSFVILLNNPLSERKP
jgi:hypothetical protein